MLACVPAQALPLQGASSCSLTKPGLNCKGGTLPLNPPLNPLSTASGRPQRVGKLKRCRSTPYNPPVQPHAQPPAQPPPKRTAREGKNHPVEVGPAICCVELVPARLPGLAQLSPDWHSPASMLPPAWNCLHRCCVLLIEPACYN